MQATSGLPTLVLTAAVPWDGIVARPQHFARKLAERGWNVLYVDGPVTWLGPLKNRELWQRALPKTALRELPVANQAGQEPGFLRILSPLANLPFGNMERFVNRFNQRVLAMQIKNSAPSPYILFSMLPGSVDLLPSLHPLASLYDCVDLHSQFSGFIRPSLVDQMERDMASVSRTVFATAANLSDRMRRWHCDVRLLRNAAEAEHFATTATVPEHPLIRDLPRPRLTMIGGIGSWIDQGFLCELADVLPTLQIVLVGPVETDVAQLAAKANIHLIGRQPYAQLPHFLAGSDAALVVHKADDPVAQSVNPVKVYEYLAADREVISTPIPELVKLSDSLWLCPTGASAADAMRRILAGERRVADKAKRALFVAENSWEARVDVIDEALHRVVPGAQGEAE